MLMCESGKKAKSFKFHRVNEAKEEPVMAPGSRD